MLIPVGTRPQGFTAAEGLGWRLGSRRTEGEEPKGPESWGWDLPDAWVGRGGLVVAPVAAPTMPGRSGFAGPTFIVASLLARWWRHPTTAAPVPAPFTLFVGGLAQLLAGIRAHRAGSV